MEVCFVTGFNGFQQFNCLIIDKDVHSSLSEKQTKTDRNDFIQRKIPDNLGLCFLTPVKFTRPKQKHLFFSWSSVLIVQHKEGQKLDEYGYIDTANIYCNYDGDINFTDERSKISEDRRAKIEYPDCPRSVGDCQIGLLKRTIRSGVNEFYVLTDDKKAYICRKEEERSGGNCIQRCELELFSISNGLDVISVSCGKEHTIVLTKDGSVYSCGSGSRGQLGIGNLENHKEPILVDSLQPLFVKAVVAGGWHSLALTDTDDLYSWGWNQSGQLGIGCLNRDESCCRQVSCTSEETCKRTLFGVMPNLVDFHTDVITVGAGSRHSAAVLKDGSIWTWGWNGYGQLGQGDKKDRHCPVVVQGINGGDCFKLDIVCNAWNTLICLSYSEKN